MLKALLAAGLEPGVICLSQGESYESDIRKMGVDVRWAGSSRNRTLRMVNIVRHLTGLGADLVQSTHFYTNLYAGLAGKLLRIPSIGAIRGDLDFEMPSHGALGRWQISLPTFLIANSRASFEQAVSARGTARGIHMVPNVVETNGSVAELSPNGLPLTLLWAGRLDENKRPERFIRMSADLLERIPDKPLNFVIAGDGPRRNELERLADVLGTASATSFLGVVDRMSDVYGHADILVNTSDHEGTPNVILEAMSHGLPVIASEVGGTPDVVDRTRGILIERGDENGLTDAAHLLASDLSLRQRLGEAGRKYVQDNHSIKRLAEQLMEIYKAACPKHFDQ